jgi:WD40 repeat protein
MEKSNSRQSGLVTNWHQTHGYLFTGGDSKVIKVWDAQQELSVMVRGRIQCSLYETLIYNIGYTYKILGLCHKYYK